MTIVEKAKALLEGKNCDNCGSTCDLNKNIEQVCKNWTVSTYSDLFRTVRLGYPNSIRGDLVEEFAMEKSKESIYYYIKPVIEDE